MQREKMIPYVLGADSGGTKYLVRAAALDGTVLAEYRGQSCSHYRFPFEEASRRISENLTACLARFGGRPEDCRAIVCGTTGYDSPEDGEILQRLYSGLEGFSCPVSCMNDVELAFRVACGRTGVIILAGTGSICFGANEAGETLRVGGWPCGIFGDEGSGRYIDALALRHYSRWMDGCREDSPFLRDIRKKTGITSRKELMDLAVQIAADACDLPGLGAIVTRSAEAGDPYAEAILKDAARCLYELTREAVRKLGLDRADRLPVGVWGSVLMNSLPVREELFRLLRQEYPQLIPRIPEKDAAQGAVEIALELAGQDAPSI